MERNGPSNCRTVCGKVCFLMTMVLVGLLFFFIIIMLAYWTYQSIIGAMVFCTLWIDLFGRLAILIVCLYGAGMCGYFPLPERYRLKWFPEPFMLWRCESWRQLFRNLCVFTPSTNLFNRIYINTIERSDSSDFSLFYPEYEERFYECDPIIRRRSAPIRINYPASYVNFDYISPSEPTGNVSPDLNKNSDESFMSFDSPICGQIVPMVKGKSSKPRYLSDSCKPVQGSSRIETAVIEKHPFTAAPNASDGGGAAKDSAKTNDRIKETATNNPQENPKANEQQKSGGTGYPIYPRFPWGFLRIPGGIPKIATKIHRRNLTSETRKIERYSRGQRQKEELDRFIEQMDSQKLVKKAEIIERNTDTNIVSSRRFEADDTAIGAPAGARPRTGLFTSIGNLDPIMNPQEETRRELARNITAEGDPAMAAGDIGALTGARPKTKFFANTRNVDATLNPPDMTQREKAGNIGVDSTTNRRRQLPSQRFGRKNRSRLHCQSRNIEENRQRKFEIQGNDDLTLPKTQSVFSASVLGSKKLSRGGQKKHLKKTAAEYLERLKRLHLTKMQETVEQDPQSDAEIPILSEYQYSFDMNASTQTADVASRNVSTGTTSANSGHAKKTEKSNSKMSFTFPTDPPKSDESDSSS